MDMKTMMAFSLIVLCAGSGDALTGEPAPKTPADCRQRVLQEIERFRKMKGPDDHGGGDEHIQRFTAMHFHGLKAETTIILAWAGDKDAVNALVKQYGLEEPSLQRWLENRQVHQSGPRGLFGVAVIMDKHRPELAKKMREELRRLATGDHHPSAPPKPNFDHVTFKQLKQAAKAGELEAMRRWACLDREDAALFLLPRMNDKERSPYENLLAAEALASSGDKRALSWMRERARGQFYNNWTGLSLLRAGEAGQKLFFELVKEFEDRNEELPYNLAQAPLELKTEVYLKLLQRLSQIKDKKFRYNVDYAIHDHRLPAATLAFLIDQARKDDRKESHLIEEIGRSIIWHGVEDAMAHTEAQLWTEELLNAEDTHKWECGAKLFLHAGLGSREVAAGSARRQLDKSTVLAVQVLAEAGRAEDAPLIWVTTHAPVKDAMTRNWYDGPSLGWFATVRLTNHLAPPK
jgi:hypothetical protein